MFFPMIVMSLVIVRPATKALGMITSSCGSGTRVVQPCVLHVRLAVPGGGLGHRRSRR
jgi:hypothetical protein